MVTHQEVQEIAELAGEKGGKTAAREILQGIGVDVDHPTEMQQDMAYLREIRLTCDKIKATATHQAVKFMVRVVLILGLLGFAWLFGADALVEKLLGIPGS